MLGIVKRFLRLVQVQILRRTALGDDYNVRLLSNGLAVERVQKRAARAMSLRHISGDGTDDLLVLVQNDIDDEINTDESTRFLNVLPYRISLYAPGAGFRLHHAAVVCLDGFARGYAGHYSLCTSRIACKVVVLNIPETYYPIRFRYNTEDIHGRSI